MAGRTGSQRPLPGLLPLAGGAFKPTLAKGATLTFVVAAHQHAYTTRVRVFPIVLAIFLIVPLTEVWLLVTVGGVVGVGWTIFLVVLTAVIGASLVRSQGISTLARSQEILARGDLPAVELLEGVALLIAGALLLTPGFFTDGVGFLLLVPPLRRRLIRSWVLKALDRRLASSRRADPGTEERPPLDGDYRRLDD